MHTLLSHPVFHIILFSRVASAMIVFGKHVLLLSLVVSIPGTEVDSITGWNLNNVDDDVPPPAYYMGEPFKSIVYANDALNMTYGGMLWVQSDVKEPGMKVMMDGEGNQARN
jgi:hypothetical protein